MHGENVPFAYGFWSLVLVNVGHFAFFLLSYLAPAQKERVALGDTRERPRCLFRGWEAKQDKNGLMREVDMKLQKIKAIAKTKGIHAGNLEKGELIRAIQKSEGSFDCYGSATSGFCDQMNCLWRDDCLASPVV